MSNFLVIQKFFFISFFTFLTVINLFGQDSISYKIKVPEDFSEVEINEYNYADNIRSIVKEPTSSTKFIINTYKDFVLSFKVNSKKYMFVDKYTKGDTTPEDNIDIKTILIIKDVSLTEEFKLDDKDTNDNLRLEPYKYSNNKKDSIDGLYKSLNVIDISNPSKSDREKFNGKIEFDYFKRLPERITFGDLIEQNKIILHQTGGPTTSSILYTFKDGKNSDGKDTLGAHYIIDTSGSIFLLVPLNKICRHAGGSYSYQIRNFNSIGIEHVNNSHVFPIPTSSDTDSILNFEKYLNLKSKLTPNLAKAFSELKNISIKWIEKHNYLGYTDILGPQKRASWLLTQKLLNDFELDDSDLVPHELMNSKAPGEGLIILDFIITKKAFDKNVDSLYKAYIVNPNTLLEYKDIIFEEKELLDILNKELEFVLGDKIDQAFVSDPNNDKKIQEFYGRFYERTTRIENIIKNYDRDYKLVSVKIEEILKDFLINELPKYDSTWKPLTY